MMIKHSCLYMQQHRRLQLSRLWRAVQKAGWASNTAKRHWVPNGLAQPHTLLAVHVYESMTDQSQASIKAKPGQRKPRAYKCCARQVT
jgi:hypothetical protein